MKRTHSLLKLLTERFPPTGETRHNLSLEKGGLLLAVNVGDHWQTFLLEEAELDDDPKTIVDDIAVMMSAAEAAWPAMQEAKARGQIQ